VDLIQEVVMSENGKSEAQQFYENFVPADSMSWSAGSQGWAEAVAKDERMQNTRHVQQVSRTPHQMSRGDYLRRQDWNRTVRGIHRQMTSQHLGQVDTSSSAQGGGRGFFAEYSAWFFGLLGLS
jgi:hypothetical protein